MIIGIQVLIDSDTASIAIWNRNKIVTTLSITIWGISTAFHIKSKPLPTLAIKDLEFYSNSVR
jgi:hypothetical protein